MFGKKKDAKAAFMEEEIPPEEVVSKHKAHEALHVSGIQLGFSIGFLVLGILLLFVKQVTPAIFCYALAGAIMGIGVILIVRYFLTEAYKNIQSYGFSFGVLLILCGSIILARTSVLSQYLILALGALMLAASVFKVQNALDLKAIKDNYWWVWLLIAFLFAIFSALIIVNPFSDKAVHAQFASVLILIDGIISLIGTFYLSFRLRFRQKAGEEASGTEDTTGALESAKGKETSAGAAQKTQEEPGIQTPGIQEDFDKGID